MLILTGKENDKIFIGEYTIEIIGDHNLEEAEQPNLKVKVMQMSGEKISEYEKIISTEPVEISPEVKLVLGKHHRGGKQFKIGIDAPKNINIHRGQDVDKKEIKEQVVTSQKKVNVSYKQKNKDNKLSPNTYHFNRDTMFDFKTEEQKEDVLYPKQDGKFDVEQWLTQNVIVEEPTRREKGTKSHNKFRKLMNHEDFDMDKWMHENAHQYS